MVSDKRKKWKKEYDKRPYVKLKRQEDFLEWRKNGRLIDFKKEDKREYNDLTKQVLIGSLLGDGCITLVYKRGVRYGECHCMKQKEYLLWKKKIFEKDFKNCFNYREYTQGHKSYKMCRLHFDDISLYPYYTLIYKNGKKQITSELLNQIDERALAVWYLDDGSLGKSVTVTISVVGYGNKSCERFVKWMKKKYKIEFIIMKTKVGNVLRLRKKESLKFIELIKPYVQVKCLKYKISVKENIAKSREYYQRPEVKARIKEYQQRSKGKVKGI